AQERTKRLGSVLSVIYLIFTEGSSASSGADLIRLDLASGALRLARGSPARFLWWGAGGAGPPPPGPAPDWTRPLVPSFTAHIRERSRSLETGGE
uniref:DUF6596 domain-containing protein n=1 Tax=Nocardia asiatica TaxID=209252 RepID=UPI00313B7771